MTTWEKVWTYCREEGISIREFEKRCGLSNGTISKWKNHCVKPATSTILKLAKATGLSVLYFMEDEDE